MIRINSYVLMTLIAMGFLFSFSAGASVKNSSRNSAKLSSAKKLAVDYIKVRTPQTLQAKALARIQPKVDSEAVEKQTLEKPTAHKNSKNAEPKETPIKSALTVIDYPHFSLFAEKLKATDEIIALYKTSLSTWDKKEQNLFKTLWSQNESWQNQFLKNFKQATPYVRGEIEQESVLNSTLARYQLLLMKIKADFFAKKWKNLTENIELAFTIPAEIPYQEASLVGLRLGHAMRSLLLDELEGLDVQKDSILFKDNQFLTMLQKARLPWPIDRVMLSDAKRLSNEKALMMAEVIAAELQKNPYQSAEKIIKEKKWARSQETEVLIQLWREQDIAEMQIEMNRFGKLLLKYASLRFEHLHKNKPEQAEQLVKEDIIQRVPVDYTTGKPMSISL